MNRWYPGPARACFFALACALVAPLCHADDAAAPVPADSGGGADAVGDGLRPAPNPWRLAVSPYTQHWRHSDEHKPVWAIGLERQDSDGSLIGGSYFSNSFGQPSAYVYYGERYTGFWGQPKLFAQWSAGVIYGYKGKYEDKLPLNHKGFAPGALLSMGWNFDRSTSVAAHLLGDAGVMLQMSYQFR